LWVILLAAILTDVGKKNTKTNRRLQKTAMYYGVAILVFILVIALVLCWSNIKRIYYGHQASSAFSTALTNLRSPLNTFGFQNIEGTSSKCVDESIYGYATLRLQCSAMHQAYVVIGNNPVQKNSFVAKAEELDMLLKQSGWTENGNTTPTIGQWFQGITSGKDWYSDEGAYENVGNQHCGLDFFVAYSSPKPPAFTLQLACSSPRLQKIETDL
jgi:hypothetical protein